MHSENQWNYFFWFSKRIERIVFLIIKQINKRKSGGKDFKNYRDELNPGSKRQSTGFNVYTKLNGDTKENNIGRIFSSFSSLVKKTQKVAKSTEMIDMFSTKSKGNKYIDKWTDSDGNYAMWN